MASLGEPLQSECADGPWADYWTSPCCYARIDRRGRHSCPQCGRLIECQTEMRPFNVATLVRDDGNAESEGRS